MYGTCSRCNFGEEVWANIMYVALSTITRPSGTGTALKTPRITNPIMLDTRIPDLYWISKSHKRGVINELKVGYNTMSTGSIWKELADDWDLLYMGWGVARNGPFKGRKIPVSASIWWFLPNRGGVSNPAASLLANLEEDGINSIVIEQERGAPPPPPPKKQSRKQQDREATELESGKRGEIQEAVDTLFGPQPIFFCVP